MEAQSYDRTKCLTFEALIEKFMLQKFGMPTFLVLALRGMGTS